MEGGLLKSVQILPKQSNWKSKGISTEMVCMQRVIQIVGVWLVEENTSPTPRKVQEKIQEAVGSSEEPTRTVFHCYMTNHHKLSGLKQHVLISSQLCMLEVQHGTALFSAQGLSRLCSHIWSLGSYSTFVRSRIPFLAVVRLRSPFPSMWPTLLTTWHFFKPSKRASATTYLS